MYFVGIRGLGHAGKDKLVCIPRYWRCLDNLKCVSESSRCNGIYDCQDRSDEMNCSAFDNATSSEGQKGKNAISNNWLSNFRLLKFISCKFSKSLVSFNC